MDKELINKSIAKLHEFPVSIWFTGLSGSGKTTLTKLVYELFVRNGYRFKILDGDSLRTGINSNLGFSIADRTENIRRAAEVSKLFNDYGVSTLNAFICPTNILRKFAASVVGSEKYVEIYLDSPLDVCEKRDPKGLYAKCRRGEIENLTGIDSPFDIPENPHFEVKTSKETPDESANRVFEFICGYICRIKR